MQLDRIRTTAMTLGLAALLAHTTLEAQTTNGAFRRTYADAARLLEASQATRAAVTARLARSPGATLTDPGPDQIRATLRNGAGRNTPAAGLPREVEEVLTRARELRWQILDVYADPAATDPRAAAERQIDAYLARGGVALSPLPKAPSVLDGIRVLQTQAAERMGHGEAGGQAAHAGHRMAPMDHSFRGKNAEVNRLLWSQQWLENALFEPLMVRRADAERRAGVAETISRFEAMVAGLPDGRPTAAPTTAAIAPELTIHHPRAAVILNHLHMLESAILDLYALEGSVDREGALRSLVRELTTPNGNTVEEHQWLRVSLRSGIYFQGGPPLGRMAQPDRNADSPINAGHDGHRTIQNMPRGI